MYPELASYNFGEIIYLKKFLFLPSSRLYQTLKQYYKIEYASNDRIVIAFQGEIPYDLLAHLQRVVQHLDITNFFIVLCNTDTKTKETMDQVHSKYSTDSTKFELCSIDIDDQAAVNGLTDHSPLLNPPETMCMYPWTNLEIKPIGEARVCCVIDSPIHNDQNNSVYNINKVDQFNFKDLYYSKDVQALRDQFRQGYKPKACVSCWRNEERGITSQRQGYNHDLKDQLFDIDYELDDVSNLTSLDLKLGNLCNLSCRICNATLSSTWATENLKGLPHNVVKNHPAYRAIQLSKWTENNTGFWDELISALPTLKFLWVSGGETFMVPALFQALELSKDHADHIKLKINTNGTIYSEYIFNILKEFKSVKLCISIDNIKERFEYERNHASWKDLLENIQKFNQHRSENFVTEVNCTVNIQNIFYLPEFCEWLKGENFDSVFFNIVQGPQWVTISQLTLQAKEVVLSKLKNYNFGKYQLLINPFIFQIEKTPASDGRLFLARTRELDLIRKQNFSKTHTEIANAMGYVLN